MHSICTYYKKDRQLTYKSICIGYTTCIHDDHSGDVICRCYGRG